MEGCCYVPAAVELRWADVAGMNIARTCCVTNGSDHHAIVVSSKSRMQKPTSAHAPSIVGSVVDLDHVGFNSSQGDTRHLASV